MITLNRGGVGSLEEAIADALLKGYSFVIVDNVRGRVDCPMLESALTEDTVNARVPYGRNVDVDTRGLNLGITSNKAELTEDLANRTSCVRIRKRPKGYAYLSFPEGDLLDHVRANRELFLGAIFAIVRAWYEAGMPQTNESRHDFRHWAQRLDWIIQHIFCEAPLLDGHADVRARVVDSNTSWVRDLAFAVVDCEKLDGPLRASELLDILADHGMIEIPGIAEDDDVTGELVRRKANQAIGGRLARFFADTDHRMIDGIEASRTITKDESYRDLYVYSFRRCDGGEEKDTPQEVLF